MVFNWLTWDAPIQVCVYTLVPDLPHTYTHPSIHKPQTSSNVWIGNEPHPSALTLHTTGEVHLFTDCGSQHIQRTIHEVHVTNLNASTTYYYQVGDPHLGYSDIFSFTTGPDAETLSDSLPHHFIFFGDMGNENSQACAPATEMVLEGDINAVFHVGDMVFTLETPRLTVYS